MQVISDNCVESGVHIIAELEALVSLSKMLSVSMLGNGDGRHTKVGSKKEAFVVVNDLRR